MNKNLKTYVKQIIDKDFKDQSKKVNLDELVSKIENKINFQISLLVDYYNAEDMKYPICPKCKSKDIETELEGCQYTTHYESYNSESDSFDFDEDQFGDFEGDPTARLNCRNCGFEGLVKTDYVTYYEDEK